MKTLIGIIALLTATTVCASQAPPLPTRVSDAIHARIDAGQYPVIVVAVVDGDQSAVYAFGKLPDGKPPTGDTLFEIGSITKTFTTLLLAQDVTDKRLSLDAPVAGLLPGFAIPQRGTMRVTLENLAEQHSGLPRMPTNFGTAHPLDPYRDYGPDDAKAFLASYVLSRDPGATYEYSNFGVALLGYALATHDGVDYPTLVRQRIFTPLGMTESTAEFSDKLLSRLAPGHDALSNETGNWRFRFFAPAGAIISSANDMLRYLKANMGSAPSPLYPAMLLAHAPRTAGPGGSNRIGLAWNTHHEDTGDFVWHNGATGGYSSFIGFTADRRHGVVILTNIQHSVDDIGMGTLNPNMPIAATRKIIAVPGAALDEYVGQYQLFPGFVLRFFRNGTQLMAQATGQPAIRVFLSARDEVFATAVDVSVSFTRGADGRISGLILHQHGDHVARRIPDTETTIDHRPQAQP